jgi:membrane-associated phospholipid phosphatase
LPLRTSTSRFAAARSIGMSVTGIVAQLDALDVAISGPVFRLELPRLLELALTVPSQFCGMPATSLVLGPLMAASVATANVGLACCTAAAALMLGICWFALLLQHGVRDGTDRMLGSPTGVLFAPFLTLAFLGRPSLWWGTAREGEMATGAGAFYAMCYFVSQLLTASIKWSVLRRRPVHLTRSRSLGLGAVRRHAPLAAECKYVGDGIATYESFPSGDTVQAVQAATMLWMLAAQSETAAAAAAATAQLVGGVGFAFALCTAFGRVYFHAHHAADVVAGAALGHVVPRCMEDYILPWRECGWMQAVATWAVFVGVQATVRRHYKGSLEARAGLQRGSTRDPWRSMNRSED